MFSNPDSVNIKNVSYRDLRVGDMLFSSFPIYFIISFPHETDIDIQFSSLTLSVGGLWNVSENDGVDIGNKCIRRVMRI